MVSDIAVGNIDDPLIAADDQGQVSKEGLVTDWQTHDAGDVVTLTIRSGVKFQNGEPLTAADVTYSFETWKEQIHGVSASVRQGLRSQFHALLHRCRQRKSLRVVALGQRLRHFADRITTTVGEAHGARVRNWFHEKKVGWYAVLADPQMPAMSTVLDQAHNAIDRKLFAMKGFHHPGGSQAALLTGLAHLYNVIPYQRRALNAGLCGVQVEGGRVPTSDWMLNLQILTSGGYRYAPDPPNH